jgi:hypothetical protein
MKSQHAKMWLNQLLCGRNQVMLPPPPGLGMRSCPVHSTLYSSSSKSNKARKEIKGTQIRRGKMKPFITDDNLQTHSSRIVK